MSGVLKRETIVLQSNGHLLNSVPSDSDTPETGELKGLTAVPAGFFAANDVSDFIKTAEAQRVLEQAQTQAAEMQRQAEIQGEQQGRSQGRALAAEESERQEQAAVRLIKENYNVMSENLREEHRKKLEQLQSEELGLAFELTEKILKIEIDTDEQAFVSLFLNAASHMPETQKATLKAGPRGCEIALRNRDEFQKSIRGLEEFEIVRHGDDNGFCLIESPYGSIDAGILVQLQKAAAVVGVENTGESPCH